MRSSGSGREDAQGRGAAPGPVLPALAALGRERARAEASEYAAAMAHLSREAARLQADGPFELREATRSAIVEEIARSLGWSTHQAHSRLARAYRAKSLLPRAWSAFAGGALDAARLLVLGEAAGRLHEPVSHTWLDDAAVEFAPGRTVRELRDFTNAMVARLEPENLEEAATHAHAGRRVWIEDRGDGMSELWALIPTLRAGVIDAALTAAGKRRTRRAAGSGTAAAVTLAQARADVLAEALSGGPAPTTDEIVAAEWEAATVARVAAGEPCLCHGLPTADAPFAEPGDPPLEMRPELPDEEGVTASAAAPEAPAPPIGLAGVNVHIGVVVPVETLAGDAEQPGTSWDGRWVAPAHQIRELATGEGPARVFWHRILTGTGGDVLKHEYAGRFAPETLRHAIAFRDATCAVAGCPAPVSGCDIDHRTPWPEGPTRGDNAWGLCRRHHRWKSWGVIEPLEMPRSESPQAPDPPRTHGAEPRTTEADEAEASAEGASSTKHHPGTAPPEGGRAPSGWSFRFPGGSIVPADRPSHRMPPRRTETAAEKRLRRLLS